MNDLTRTTETPRWFTAILVLGMLVFAFYASTHMVAAGDTWVALACGRHFANHGVDTVEPFSFNSHHAGPTEEDIAKWPPLARALCKPFSLETIQKWHPTGWINQNWLTHLIFYKLATWFGQNGGYNYNTLVYWKFAIYFIAVFCVFFTGKIIGAGNILSAAGACMAMVVGRTFFDIRPAGYSNLLVPAYILILALATYRNYRWIWLLVPLVVFWANVHGGYLYAFIMLVPFVGIHVLLRTPRRWSLCLGFIGLWGVLYLMSYKFINNGYHEQVRQAMGRPVEHLSLMHDKMLYIWLVLSGISLALVILKNVPYGAFAAYHFLAGGIYFISLLLRFMVEIPPNLSQPFREIYSSMVSSSIMGFIFVGIVGVGMILAMALKKDQFVALPTRGICHAVAAGVVSFLAMIIFNPFHLTNLTHTFEISISKHAESWRQVNEWKPAFDWMDKTTTTPNPVGDEEAFAVLCILTLAALAVWLITHFLKPRFTGPVSRKGPSPEMQVSGFEWPKIDPAIIVISLLTIYMAVKSRRFIAIAGSAAAPAVALMILQSWQMITARLRWKKEGTPEPMVFSPVIRTAVQGMIVLVLLGLGAFWSMKYKHIYLDPWPTDDRYHSVFMRMTASHLKPFEVCQFINDNQISGRIFNYWTEGGAIAFGQKPDPKTGHIPLKLFMDGRAQAAYNHAIFRLWQLIFSGGPAVAEATTQGKKITAEILGDSGQWIDAQLKDRQVWVVLMPESQENSTFMQALKTTGNWKTVYIDNTQHLLVDTQTPQGQILFEAVLQGNARFPDVYSRDLTTATAIIESQYSKRYVDLFTLAKNAFEAHSYPGAIQLIARLVNISQFREPVIEELRHFVDDFREHQSTYIETDGALLQMASADIAARYLSGFVPEEKEHYRDLSNQFRAETATLNQNRIW